MAREQRLPPRASSLTASMRDLGYSLETAVADLIDNSISADATDIRIFCDLARAHPTLAIIDNGRGMNAEEIIAAMRHGAADPRAKRSPTDLGRFGLGLKTASFSQCRRLTVASAQDGLRAAAEWDLDVVDEQDDWIISVLDESEIAELPFIEQLGERGTIVLWRALDRLFEDETGHTRDEIVNEKLDALEKHLALVFHRFLAGEIRGRRKLSIAVNGHQVQPFDPFCRKNPATQMLPEQPVRIGGAVVKMQPYILPHHSRLTAQEYSYYRNRSDFISNQGAYIYRNGRLMAWGDWFRLIPKGEATKLARVQIDFPSSLDESWVIDIKKSRARPPYAVRESLRQIIQEITGRSTRVHRGRGQKLFTETDSPVWERYADKGRIRYTLNAEHPLVSSLAATLTDEQKKKLDLLIETVASALPVEMIYSDYSTHPREVTQNNCEQVEIYDKLSRIKSVLSDNAEIDANAFREIVKSMRLFEGKSDQLEQFISEVF